MLCAVDSTIEAGGVNNTKSTMIADRIGTWRSIYRREGVGPQPLP